MHFLLCSLPYKDYLVINKSVLAVFILDLFVRRQNLSFPFHLKMKQFRVYCFFVFRHPFDVVSTHFLNRNVYPVFVVGRD